MKRKSASISNPLCIMFSFLYSPIVSLLVLFLCVTQSLHCYTFLFLLSPTARSLIFFFVCFSLPPCASCSQLIPPCQCTITKPACLFMLHWGITLFRCYYFFVKLPQYALPQTVRCCPTLIIFSHSATSGHRMHAEAHSVRSLFGICVLRLCPHGFHRVS